MVSLGEYRRLHCREYLL